MIKNEAYYGTLVNNKSIRTVINKKNGRQNAKEDMFYHEDFFPAIVTKAVWDRAQVLIESRKKNKYRSGRQGAHLFTGIMKCANCGANMVFKRKTKHGGVYVCSTYHKYGVGQCTTHNVQENLVKKVVIKELASLIECSKVDHEKLDAEIRRKKKSFHIYGSTVSSLVEKKAKIEGRIENVLEEKYEGRISEKVANKLIAKAQSEYDILEDQIQAVEFEKQQARVTAEDLEKSRKVMELILEDNDFNRSQIEIIIEKIYIYQEKIHQEAGKRYPVDITIEWKSEFINK